MQKIAILCAGDEELKPFLPHIQQPRITENALLKLYEGSINGIQIVTLYCGVCKVNAAIATQLLIDKYGVSAVINAGTAGGMDESVELFDTVVSTQVAYYDVADDILTEFHPWMPSIYFNADENLLATARTLGEKNNAIRFGRTVTGEKFIDDGQRDDIRKKYSPLSVDMETASIAHVCYANKIPFIAIRSITDTAAHSGVENFEKNCRRAAQISCDVVLEFLKALRR